MTDGKRIDFVVCEKLASSTVEEREQADPVEVASQWKAVVMVVFLEPAEHGTFWCSGVV